MCTALKKSALLELDADLRELFGSSMVVELKNPHFKEKLISKSKSKYFNLLFENLFLIKYFYFILNIKFTHYKSNKYESNIWW